MPELRQLRSFVAIAEEGSLTKAGVRLHLAQQSLSQQMRTLEAQVGAPLLVRSPRGVALTPVGTVLLREARSILARAERGMDAVTLAAAGERADLRVGFLSSVANALMPPLVREMRARHPGIALRTEDVTIAELVGGLRDGSLDAGVSRPPLVDDLATETLLREPVAAVLPEGHPLQDCESLALSDLAGEKWVLTRRSSWPPWHAQYDEDFARAGFTPDVVERGTSPQNLLALVAAGVGITRLSLSARTLRDGGVRFVPLRDETAQVVLVWRPDATLPGLMAMRDVARTVASDITA
jgi:DNA-binding transcriptional LysR family regulator